ncbi:PREDICTED: uncharacterized protein LOC106745059 [Dinoponera quadriceps]|uniref:Uncharacterized protein LOC106745059 n=1 Tax=Dinoponera quadriceps TaxID=609295 RepID=A0A6P3XBW4_DINQU|nr:PREDICTED: uncharacterized protein LOC106745059 [Dinoponera quadriceps]
MSSLKILAEAAGVKIVTVSPEEDANTLAPGKIILKLPRINRESDNSLGFHLTKSKWDPFPWIGYVENGSFADLTGLRVGDCLLSVDGVDLLGLKITDIAALIRNEESGSYINLDVWRCPAKNETQDDIGVALKGPLPDITKNLVSALSGMIRALECPICFETAAPPVSQCVHGHILCVVCRPKMTRCPICRARLGQGRCLLADNLHRVLRDTYFDATTSQPEEKGENVASDHCSLHEQLFGKAKKQHETVAVTRGNPGTSKPKQFLLTRLLLGGREKAASADNLTRVSGIDEAASVRSRPAVAKGLLRLSSNDRAKSASTGELSRDDSLGSPRVVQRVDSASSSLQITGSSHELRSRQSQQSLSSHQTAVLSGSADSVSYAPLACPLLRLCNEVVNFHSLPEHIKSHRTPQVHFYSRSARIPLPVPFGRDAFYVLHHDGYMFFFQCGSGAAWMTCPTAMACANNATEWTLHAWNDGGSQIYLRRYVAYLEDPVTLTSEHIAPVPTSLSLNSMTIGIADHRIDDRFYA